MNRSIRQLTVGLMALYVALFGALSYWQIGTTEQLAASDDNTRSLIRQYDRPRGPIVTADGVVVARSVATASAANTYQRTYPEGDLYAHLTGYHTLRLGSTQLERLWGDELTGAAPTGAIRS